jgi:hypothetical protein
LVVDEGRCCQARAIFPGSIPADCGHATKRSSANPVAKAA